MSGEEKKPRFPLPPPPRATMKPTNLYNYSKVTTTPPSSSGSPTRGRGKQEVPPPPHSAHTAMPSFESAPPSANIGAADLDPYIAAIEAGAGLLSAAVDVLSGSEGTLEPKAASRPTELLSSGTSEASAVSSITTSQLSPKSSTVGTSIVSPSRSPISKLPLPPPPPPGRTTGIPAVTLPPSVTPPSMTPSAATSTAAAANAAAPPSYLQPPPTVAPLPPPPPVQLKPKPPPPPPPQPAVVEPPRPPPPAVQEAPKPPPPPPLQPSVRTITEPLPLPRSQFLPKTGSPSVLAARQGQAPVGLVATESAHRVAWKNKLLLADMLEGLAAQNTSQQIPGGMPPFRSLHNKSLQLAWDDLRMTFSDDDNNNNTAGMDDETAAFALQDAAVLHRSDGNLQQELELLEDQVDNLLCESRGASLDPDSRAGDDDDDDNPMDYYENRHRVLEQVTKDAFQLTSPPKIPWLYRYRQALDSSTDGQQHELYQCPAVILTVCTTQESSSPLETIRALQSPHYLPAAFRNGLYDPAAVRYEVLVLHDNVDGPKNWDETNLRRQLQHSFGPAAEILRINSFSLETADTLANEENTDLWGGGGKLGNCLSVSDRAVIRKYLASLMTSAILPALERRVADLNVIVSDRKKGVKNVLKSFWRTGKKEEEEGSTAAGFSASGHATNGDIKYRFDSVESQTRLLADTLFLVQDYDAALSMYRLIKDDFKQDKCWIHYGGVQEMMALCMYHIDPYGRSKDIFSSIENALLSYSRAADEVRPVWGEKPGRSTTAPIATRLATRLCLVLTTTTNICTGRHLEVADLLASASSHETALGAAVLLEQSSAHYFMAELYRKYAFHMLMSGHMFRSANQEHHAFRCFTSALHLYRDGKWEELHNHLLSALASQLFSMGRMAISLQLFATLVGSPEGGSVSLKSQQKFINNLLEICNEHRKKALAAADRMAAPPKLSGAERDAVRKEKLDRIVQVVRYTKSASRVLELPNMNLPRIEDSSVTVIAGEAAYHRQESVPCFGEARVGSEEIWEDLMLMTTAELKAAEKAKLQIEDEVITRTLAKIEDPEIRRVVAIFDKEKLNRNMLARTKKAASYTGKAPVRAVREPITVEFVMNNPLGIPIDLVDLQLVAKMTEEDGNRLCTNEDAVKITPLVTYNETKSWTFQGSDVQFAHPDFCRISSGVDDKEREKWKSAQEVEPFFVVTKSNITIDPKSSKMVSLSISPLTLGDLEIIGVRCRLFDDVWVYHPFDIKGPLLQNTRSNRANRVRGKSFLLKSKVERGMPCVSVDLVKPSISQPDGNAPALQAQIGEWILRITNTGTAPATHMALKTNLPWVNIADGVKKIRGAKSRAVSSCIGPTGTLMSIPFHGEGIMTDGQLNPGETTDVPIHIRTSGAGKEDFYMLFRYELVSDSAEESLRHRWLKKMFEVPVYPSLSFSANLMPSFANNGEHILSVELTNNRTDRPDKLELTLDKLTMISRQYRLEALPGQFGSGEDVLQVGWQERATVHYRVLCKKEDSSPLLLSECAFSGSNEESVTIGDKDSPSWLNFLCLERAHEHFEQSLKQHNMALARAAAQSDDDRHPRSIASIRRENTGDTSSFGGTEVSSHSSPGDETRVHPTSILRLCPEDPATETIHLSCSWKGQEGQIWGEHHIRGMSVRPLPTSKGCPIAVTATHPTHITNNFHRGPASVPVKVTLRNRLLESPVDFEFAVDAPDTFDFTGPEKYKTVLGGGEELSIPMKALLPTAGVYNLQRIRLTVDSGEEVSYRFPLQWMVTATEA